MTEQQPSDAFEGRFHEGKERDRVLFLRAQCDSRRWADGPQVLSATAGVLTECGLQKLQLTVQAVLLTKWSGRVHQRGQYSLYVRRNVVSVGADAELSERSILACLMSQ